MLKSKKMYRYNSDHQECSDSNVSDLKNVYFVYFCSVRKIIFYFFNKVTPQVLKLRLYAEVFKMQKLVWLLRTIFFFTSSLAVILYRRA